MARPWILKLEMTDAGDGGNAEFYVAFSRPLPCGLVEVLKGILANVRANAAEICPDTDEDLVVAALNKLNDRYGTDAVVVEPPYGMSVRF